MHLTTKDYGYVILQFLLFLVYLFDIPWVDLHLPALVQTIGSVSAVVGVLVMILALVQLNRHLSPFPTPKSNAQLIRTGLYKYVRHPIYSGILLTVFGYALHEESLHKLLVGFALLILFSLKSSYEEKRLMQVYPDYEDYRKSTGRFFVMLF